jgi:uncharacterized protein DUF3142
LVLLNGIFFLVRWARRPADALSDLPRVVFWAWERPEDLRFIDCEKAGVAFLAKTITLGAGGMEVRPRFQPVRMPKGCRAVATVRIEARGPDLAVTAEEIAVEIAKLGYGSRVAAVQIDFDATVSQRGLYRQILDHVKERLPEDVRLSMTALASWCIHDGWIRGLPVDEVVPMLFRMGADDLAIREHLRAGKGFRLDICKTSVGLTTDEPKPRVPGRPRVYVFHPKPWTREAASEFFQ